MRKREGCERLGGERMRKREGCERLGGERMKERERVVKDLMVRE